MSIDDDRLLQEALLQEAAERAEREGLAPGRDARVDRYRLVVRALRRPPGPELPADFARRVAALAESEGDGIEDWIVVGLLFAMGAAALLFVGPTLATTARSVLGLQLPPLPWRELGMAAVGIAIIWAIERGWVKRHPTTHA